MRRFFDSDGKANNFSADQNIMLSFQTITFVLGTHFNCPPHSWDDQPIERVYLAYNFVRAFQEKQAKEAEKARADTKRYNARGNRNRGMPIRTTSDSATLEDSFDLMNERLRNQDGR